MNLYQEDAARGPYIQTYSGGRFYLLDPDPDDIHVVDIGHALSMLCRFTGHSHTFYSVAQHCVLVSELSPGYELEGLLHDATEAYVGDLSKPLKAALMRTTNGFFQIEQGIHRALAIRFGLEYPEPLVVKGADVIALSTEVRDLMQGPSGDWEGLPAPTATRIHPLPPDQARNQFWSRFDALWTRR